MRIKVLHIITKLDVGGAQDNTLLTVKGLDRALYQVDIASSGGHAWEDRARKSADYLHIIPTLCREMSPLKDFSALLEILSLIRTQKYDIVHTHSSKAGLLGRLAAKLAGVPLVIHTVHGFPFNDVTFSARTRKFYLWLERIGAKLSDHMSMVAELNRLEAVSKKIAPYDKMSVIYSGLELSRFDDLPSKAEARKKLHIPLDAPVIGTVGRLARSSGSLEFVEMAHNLLKQFPDLIVVMVGNGSIRAQVEKAVGREKRIKLLGSREDVPDILAALDVYVGPNQWGGLGRSMTEALAAKLPVVAYPVNGVPELLIDHVSGLHAEIGDIDDLAKKTAYLLTHPEEGKRLALNGYTRVFAKFSAAKMVADNDKLYKKLLAEKGVSVPSTTPALAV